MPARSESARCSACPALWPCPDRRARPDRIVHARAPRARRRGRQAGQALLTSSGNVAVLAQGDDPWTLRGEPKPKPGLAYLIAGQAGWMLGPERGYLPCFLSCLPNLRSNLATRPPVSRIFCLPV